MSVGSQDVKDAFAAVPGGADELVRTIRPVGGGGEARRREIGVRHVSRRRGTSYDTLIYPLSYNHPAMFNVNHSFYKRLVRSAS